MQRQLSIERQEAILGELAAAGMEFNRDIDKAAFQEAAKPTWESYIAANGNELIEKIQAVQ